MKINKKSYLEVMEWAQSMNIRAESDFVIIGKCDHSTQNLAQRISIIDATEIIKHRVNNVPNYLANIQGEIDRKRRSHIDDAICSICYSSICVEEYGNAYPCAGWQGWNLGNLNDTSLKAIWEKSSKINQLRNLRKRDFPKCIECSDKLYCTMCMVRNANEDAFGNHLVVNEYFCAIAKCQRNIIENHIRTLDK